MRNWKFGLLRKNKFHRMVGKGQVRRRLPHPWYVLLRIALIEAGLSGNDPASPGASRPGGSMVIRVA